MPAQVFREEFEALSSVDWPNIFELKRRWKVSGASIVQRADELHLISAIEARRLYKQHSFRRWHKGEPYEPAEDDADLLTRAIEIADRDAGENLRTVAASLDWGDGLAELITGLPLPRVAPTVAGNVSQLSDYRGR